MKQALSRPSKQSGKKPWKRKWGHSVHCNDAWELLELPKDQKAVGSKWLFKIKTDADLPVERYKRGTPRSRRIYPEVWR